MVEAFGLLAVCAMVVLYALEGRAPIYTLAFAGACLCAAIYAFLIGSFPFMIAEGVWSVVALRKWRLRSRAEL
ncbi:MAG: hypothetical protein AAFR47_09480 [Pseudomonadota bacterium]